MNESVSAGKIRFVDTIKCACAVERLYIKSVWCYDRHNCTLKPGKSHDSNYWQVLGYYGLSEQAKQMISVLFGGLITMPA